MADARVAARPFIKSIGGKTQLLSELCKHIPPTFGTYYEPFVGGGALFFELVRLGLLKHGAVLSDANAELINAYVEVRDRVGGVVADLRLHARKHSEAHYYYVRADLNEVLMGGEYACPEARAVAFIYINKAGFNGLWRVNRRGECNVPWGKHGKYEPDEENLRACSAALQGVDLVCYDFRLVHPCLGDFVYADSPYFPVSKTANFTGYTKGGFGMDEQRALACRLDDLADAGVHVLASNADTPECRETYESCRDADGKPTFELHEVQARRSVNSVGTKRGKVGELIIVGRGE